MERLRFLCEFVYLECLKTDQIDLHAAETLAIFGVANVVLIRRTVVVFLHKSGQTGLDNLLQVVIFGSMRSEKAGL